MMRRASAGFALLLFGLAAAAAVQDAAAQMMLPGALNGNASGTKPPSGSGAASEVSGAPPYVPPKPVIIKPPAEDTILGHALLRDGKQGAMTFDRTGEDIVLSKLTFAGDKISKPNETCSVDVPIPTPVVTKPVGRPAGAIRFDVPIDACPFTIDVLAGAGLVSPEAPTCDFKIADCRVSPGGLWGPASADIAPKRVKELEHERARIETTMRANFRALLKRAGKDRDAVKAIARDQAGFSSDREMTCRDYDQESVHGFCSTQITTARALALLAKFNLTEPSPRERAHAAAAARPKPKPTPKASVPAAAQ